jgi:colanic acid/amylovoran biosynthesis glycosyltransferase
MVVPIFPRRSETFIVSKFLGLLERGWDVHVVCGRRDDGAWATFPELTRDAGLRRRVHEAWPSNSSLEFVAFAPLALASCILAAPLRTAAYLRRGFRLFGWRVLRHLYLDAALVCLGPDIVHFEFGALAPDRMHLAELISCKIVVSFRGYDLNYVGLDHPGHYDEVWKRAAALHFLGNDLRRRAQRRGCPPDKPSVLIAPAIDARYFAPDRASSTEDPGKPLRILSVGRLEWKKGYEDALVALRQLREAGVQFEYRIVGDGEYIGCLGFARHQLGLEDVVTFAGSGPREFVREEMKAADVFLHAAVSEGFCNAVLEAQAMELPVVCTDADGLPENVEDGVTGLVVARRSPRPMANALQKLAEDPALRRRMGEAGRRRVATQFRLEDQVSAFDAFYRSVLDGSVLSVARLPSATSEVSA